MMGRSGQPGGILKVETRNAGARKVEVDSLEGRFHALPAVRTWF
jgi:hypothetical protein